VPALPSPAAERRLLAACGRRDAERCVLLLEAACLPRPAADRARLLAQATFRPGVN
jgi:hypothetical protein